MTQEHPFHLKDGNTTAPALYNIACKDCCLLCILNYTQGEPIYMYNCNLNLCEKHMQILMNFSV
jgi:hypothetical protein